MPTPFTSGSPSIADRWLNGSATVLWIGDSISEALETRIFQVLRVTPAGLGVRGADYDVFGSDTWYASAAGALGATGLISPHNYSPFPSREIVFNGVTVPTTGAPATLDARFAADDDPAYLLAGRTDLTLGSADWLAAAPALSARVICYANPNGSVAVGRNFVRGSGSVTVHRGVGPFLNLNAAAATYVADDFAVTPPAAGESFALEAQSFAGATPAAGSHFVICAALVRTGGPGFTFIPASNGGWDVLKWLDTTVISDAALMSVLSLLGLSDIVISLGQNNPAGQTSAQFQASLLQLVMRLRTAAPAASIVFCPTYDTNGGHLPGFVDAQYAAHLATPNSAFLNLFAAAGSFAQINALGYLSDGVHPTDAGKVYVLQTIQSLLDTLQAGDRATAAGRYATRGDLEDLFGADNVNAWARADGTALVLDVARIQRALDAADATIDDFFRDGPYAVPLTAPTGPSRPTVARWAATLAGVALYRSRPTSTSSAGSSSLTVSASGPISLSASSATTSSSKSADPYTTMLTDLFAELAHHKSGTRHLATDLSTPTLTHAPAIVS